MGLDAEMMVRTPEALSDEAIMQLSCDVADAFGRDQFWIKRWEHAALERYAPTDYDGMPPGHYVRVSTLHRFYGPGYERGNFPFLRTLADWLEYRTGGEVFYGSDAMEGVPRWDAEQRQRDFEHFATHGHRPYRDRNRAGVEPLKCEWCRLDMRESSYGPHGRVGYVCTHCGHEDAVEPERVS